MNSVKSALKAFTLGLATFAALTAPPPVDAQTVITGHYDQHSGDGYLVQYGTFIVGPDTASGPSATFNGNSVNGLGVYEFTVTVAGGQYSSNAAVGLGIYQWTGSTVTGGLFSNNATGVRIGYECTAIITNGTFNGNRFGLDVEDFGTATVTGGSFSGSTQADFTASTYGVIDLYGQFIDPATGQFMTSGQTVTLPSNHATPLSGSFIGSLGFGSTQTQTFRYLNTGTITLHSVTAPEPSQYAVYGIAVLGLAGLALKARRRCADSSHSRRQ